VNELLKGRAPITADSAERLEWVLGHDAGFWLRLEANYQQDLVRLQQLEQLASQKDWLKELPLRWMQGEGWVDTHSHAGQQVSACLKFFAVASIDCEADPTLFVSQLMEPAGAAGMAVVFVPAPPGCRVSGVTSWLSSDRALIALSLRHKTNDHLWFTRPPSWMASMVWMKCMRMKPIASLRIS
jgi:hypothetical protein